jgi:excisionase family DNA binding protein
VSITDVVISASAAGPVPKRAYSIPQACTALDLGLNSVKRLVENGTLPSIHIGRRVLILAEDLDAMLARIKAGAVVEMNPKGRPPLTAPPPAPSAPAEPKKKGLSPRLAAHLAKLNAKPRAPRA